LTDPSASAFVYFLKVSIVDQRIGMHALFAVLPLRRQLVTEGVAFPHFKPGK
jgi:hypothetical protein